MHTYICGVKDLWEYNGLERIRLFRKSRFLLLIIA
jgi:hypothetical protein